ncbi:hypothetical protein KAURM247S_02252 [Kitasatospora aureofaciens]
MTFALGNYVPVHIRRFNPTNKEKTFSICRFTRPP